MAKFKVGDRVNGHGHGSPGTVMLFDDTEDAISQYYVKFDDGLWDWMQGYELAPLAPAVPGGWREIEPERKARYVVCLVPTEYTTLEDAEKHALQSVEGMRVNAVIARVVEEVKPGKPVITKLEE